MSIDVDIIHYNYIDIIYYNILDYLYDDINNDVSHIDYSE